MSLELQVKLLTIIAHAISLPERDVTYPEYDFTLRTVPDLPRAFFSARVLRHMLDIVPLPPHIVRLLLKAS